MDRRVVVTGLGLITPLGIGLAESWSALCAGKSGIGAITRFDATDFDTQIAGEVKDFHPQDFLPKKEAKRTESFIAYAVAASRMASERRDHTLSATALVHEAYLQLVDTSEVQQWDGRGHFFASAAEAMRRLLVNHATRRGRPKHGGDRQRIEFDEQLILDSEPNDQILDVNEALDKLSSSEPQCAEIVKLKYFAGLTIAEIAELMSAHEGNPGARTPQKAVAWDVTARVHGEEIANRAAEATDLMFGGGNPAEAQASTWEMLAGELPSAPLPDKFSEDVSVVDLVSGSSLVKSNVFGRSVPG